MTDSLNPLQQDIIDSLGIPSDWSPLPPSVISEAETQLIEALEPVAASFSRDDSLRVTKHMLATVHGCEAHFLESRRAPFAWNLNTVRGTIAHKGIELALNWRGAVLPADLADAAFLSIMENPRESASEFLHSLEPHEEAELRGTVVVYLTTFLECFPPLKAAWKPVVEYPVTYSLFGGAIVLSARMDLVIGGPGRKVLLDVKTGRIMPVHRDDLRFYALVESLRSRQAPRQLGTYSLEAARLDEEPVTEGLLQSAVKRTAAGTALIADLVTGVKAPDVRPGAQCRWCPLNETCEQGVRHLRTLAGDDDE